MKIIRYFRRVNKAIIILFILVSNLIVGQNLVPNPSFENYVQCPNTSNLFSLNMAFPWESAIVNSTDYWHQCNTVDFPQINVTPYSGGGIAGFYTINGYGGDYREYLQVLLNDTLKQDSCYYFECFLLLSRASSTSSSEMGVLFSLSPITNGVGMFNSLVDTIPHIENNKTNLLDTLNWMRINGIYKSIGNEAYLLFGNFYPDSLTDTIPGPNYDPFNPSAITYFWVDDFTLKLIPNTISSANAGGNQTIIQGDSVQIGNNPLSDAVYSWYPSAGLNDTTLENPVAKPTVTTTYYCIKDACNSQTIDSVTVTVTPNNISEFYNSTNISLYPNPNTGEFTIIINEPDLYDSYLKIYHITGQLILKQTIDKPTTKINFNTYPKGIYFYNITNGSQTYSGKLVIQ